MGSREGGTTWSVFDAVNTIPSTPEALMAEIDAAIAALEYARATLSSPSTKASDVEATPQYDARLADEAYRAGCGALAVGNLDDALYSLQISLSKCPPENTSAVAKLQSLISLTSQKLQKPLQ